MFYDIFGRKSVRLITNHFLNNRCFTFETKLRDAVQQLLNFIGVLVVLGIFYIIYMVNSVGSISDTLNFSMAVSNTYGILLITVLLGNGLVSLPIRLWLMSDPELELQRLYLSVSMISHAKFYTCSLI